MADTILKGGLRTAVPRRRRRRAARPAAPWRAWVEALLARYLRRPARPGGAERVLARPPRPLSRVRERWLLASRTLLPQLHLAIQPVLRPRLRQVRPVLAAPRRSPDIRSERTLRERTLAGRPFSEAAVAPARTVLALRELIAAGPMTSAMRLPLQLVFQRLREPARALGAVTAARREAALAAGPALARRLSEKSRRVEQAPAGAPSQVMARREASPAAASAIPGPPAAPWDLREARAAQARWSGPVSGLPAVSPPAVNVAALADQVMQQIDGRLHAWRERTGL